MGRFERRQRENLREKLRKHVIQRGEPHPSPPQIGEGAVVSLMIRFNLLISIESESYVARRVTCQSKHCSLPNLGRVRVGSPSSGYSRE
jgi:hypothetical protein